MLRRDIKTLWDDIRVWLTDATKSAVKEAEDLTRRGRLRMELMRLSRDIEKTLAQLGGRVYDRMSKTPDAALVADEDLKRLVREIARLELELQTRRREYEAEKNR
jgi:uncharacterized protein (UPF0335 family)